MEQPSRSEETQQKQSDMQAAIIPDHWGEDEREQADPMTGELHGPEVQDTAQPTLAGILRVVNNCTASINTLKEQFGGLREDVSLLRQDVQKIHERTTSVESRVSEVEDQIPPMA